MSDIEVLAITGLDDAIIGTTLKNGREVLAYDYDKAVAIIQKAGYSEELAEAWLDKATNEEFDGSPAFIFLDRGAATSSNDREYYGFSGITVH
tara:strand:- start:334 stop:612 length:279 start_codon:yes stop_codon:yes gene_type:complete